MRQTGWLAGTTKEKDFGNSPQRHRPQTNQGLAGEGRDGDPPAPVNASRSPCVKVGLSLPAPVLQASPVLVPATPLARPPLPPSPHPHAQKIPLLPPEGHHANKTHHTTKLITNPWLPGAVLSSTSLARPPRPRSVWPVRSCCAKDSGKLLLSLPPPPWNTLSSHPWHRESLLGDPGTFGSPVTRGISPGATQ